MSQEAALAHGVLIEIRRIVKRISEHSKHLSREIGLTVPQLVCLKAVGEMETEHDEVTVNMVAHRVQLAPATVSRIVDRLTTSGLLHRERRSQDRRKVCLNLTPAGVDRYNTLPIPLQDRFVKRFSQLEEGEQRRLTDALSTIATLMDAEELDASPILTPGAHIRQAPDTSDDH